MTNNLKAITPDNVLSDNQDKVYLNGILVRKGSIAAFMQNVDLFENPENTQEQQDSIFSVMQELAPAMIAAGLYKHVVFKNKSIQALLDQVASELKIDN